MPLHVEPIRDRKLYRLARRSEELMIPRGREIYARGEPATAVFLVRRGHVRLTLEGEGGGEERTVAVAGPWELFGEEAMIPGATRPYAAVAGERCGVSLLEGPAVRGVLRTSPHTLTTYLEVKEHELRLLRVAAGGSPRPSSRQRLAAVLLDLAERMGQEGEGILVPHWFTHRELADLCGAHRSTVTTTLNDWLYDGVIDDAPTGIRIARPDDLRKCANGG